jgi:hypothetical protein
MEAHFLSMGISHTIFYDMEVHEVPLRQKEA